MGIGAHSNHDGERSHTIVVGIDGSAASIAALRWAMREAAATGRRVQVVHAWHYLPEPTSILMAPARATRADEERWARTLLDDAVEEALSGQGVKPPVGRHLVEGDAAEVLLDAARNADLLVVGARRHGIVHGALFGSVSQRCAAHATGPVVVPPEPDADAGGANRAAPAPGSD